MTASLHTHLRRKFVGCDRRRGGYTMVYNEHTTERAMMILAGRFQSLVVVVVVTGL